MKEEVEIIETGPREALQSHQDYIDIESKLRLIDMLFDAGFEKMEVTSLVHPKVMPQMKDAIEIMSRIRKRPGKFAQVLVPNETGCRNAIACDAKELVVWIYSTDKFNFLSHNKNRSETLKEISSIIQISELYEAKVSAWIGGAFGYPGINSSFCEDVKGLAAKLIQLGCTEVCLGDEFCSANPRLVREVLKIYLEEIESSRLLVHFHDNRGLGLANIFAAYEEGIRKFKACIGGAGRYLDLRVSEGNELIENMFPSIPTEDLVYAFEEMGIHTGVDFNMLIECGMFAEKLLKRELHSLVIANNLRLTKH